MGTKINSFEFLSYDKYYRRVETACNFEVQTKLSESEPKKTENILRQILHKHILT
jgi:hypothetical protein